MTTNYEVADIVDYEGLEYAIQSYTDGSDFEDETLRQMWQECKLLLNKIEKYLEPYMPEDFND